MFKKLKVKEVKKETNNAISIVFDVSADLKDEFNYQSGQYVTVKKNIDGEDVRRAYSLSSSPDEEDYRIGVKKIEGGKMSSFLNDNLSVGDELDVMPPKGNFLLNSTSAHSVGFAAGSGITPIISMIKSVLKANGTFTLFYVNKTSGDIIFKSELDALKNDYPNNFHLNYIYTREETGNQFFEGRINKEKCNELMKSDLDLLKADGFYMCGPEEMIVGITSSLKELGVNESKIHFELFTASSKTAEVPVVSSRFSGESQVRVIMDGEEFDFELSGDGDFILDAAIEHGADAPFSCKGAVCCTCKAKVIEGKAIMEMNYSLSDEEVEEGYILTCQAHPASEKVVVDYDVT
ncbi:MAG: 2Fe-2S iron-sulfur cluster binding domain-containing protein [Vicingus serpentipes]|nr:2Fe-2S iron-sulfur cluster binding domain-containing protein [Vicingus serpentipes]